MRPNNAYTSAGLPDRLEGYSILLTFCQADNTPGRKRAAIIRNLNFLKTSTILDMRCRC